jgi:hypothetical protein
MEAAMLITTISLALFAILAVFDGFYLHIFKYRLYQHPDSKTEHLTHTLRAVLFPVICYFLFLAQNSETCFYIGLAAVTADIAVLGWDAFLEKDSRASMGGLPRWEYILHLFVNGFHFATIAAFLSMRLDYSATGIEIVPGFDGLANFTMFQTLVVNLLPGAVLLAGLHIMVALPASARAWDGWRERVRCC